MIQPLDEQLVERIDRYIAEIFAPEAEAAGLPQIQISANEGKLLYLIVKMCRTSAFWRLALAGYSTTSLARALPAGGFTDQLWNASLCTRRSRSGT